MAFWKIYYHIVWATKYGVLSLGERQLGNGIFYTEKVGAGPAPAL